MLQRNICCSRFALAVFCLLPLSYLSAHEPPIGEEAYYDLSRDSSRTSSFIVSGQLEGKVPRKTAEGDFIADMSYDMRVQFIGRKEGGIEMPLPARFFAETFGEEMEKVGLYESEQFKAQHIGKEDVNLPDGRVYKGCHLVRFYDISEELLPRVALFTKQPMPVEDLEMVVRIYPGIPVLGAVQVDITGKQSSVSFKTGFDIRP